jgi:hypothetical protein
MCIATRCTSVEQFIQMFHRFVDDESFFISTMNTRPPGLETPFAVQLVDGTPVLKGLCVVLQAWPDANNPFKTPGVRLGIKRLTANSMIVFEQLLVTRSAQKLPTPPASLTRPPPMSTTKAAPLVIAPLKPIATSQDVRRDSQPEITPIPTPVPPEISDMVEEKTNVREQKTALAELEVDVDSLPAPPSAMPPIPAQLKPTSTLPLGAPVKPIATPASGTPSLAPPPRLATPPAGTPARVSPLPTAPMVSKTATPIAPMVSKAATPPAGLPNVTKPDDAAKPAPATAAATPASPATPAGGSPKVPATTATPPGGTPRVPSATATPSSGLPKIASATPTPVSTVTPTSGSPAVPASSATPPGGSPRIPAATATPSSGMPRTASTATPPAGMKVATPPAGVVKVSSTATPPADTPKLERTSTNVDAIDLSPPEPDPSRTPGSELVLPANPLMNLTDESLEGYVDCRLYEQTGNFFPVEDDPSVIVDDVVPPPGLGARATTPATAGGRQRTITPLPAAPIVPAAFDAPDTEQSAQRYETQPQTPGYDAALRRDSAPSILVPPPTPGPTMPRESVMVDPSLIARGSMPMLDGVDAPVPYGTGSTIPPYAGATGSTIAPYGGEAPPYPGGVPPYAKAPTIPPYATGGTIPPYAGGALATPNPNAPAVPVSELQRRVAALPRWMLYGGVASLAAIVVIVTVAVSSSDGTAAAPKQEAAAPAPVAHAMPPVAPAPVEPQPDLPDEALDPSPGDGPPIVGAGPCSVVVNTTPAGSTVIIDGTRLGPSPVTVAASCDKHRLDIKHPRYQATSKLVSLTDGKTEEVEVTLQRPTHSVLVTSNPPGATIFIDGRRAGTTPTRLSVLGFVQVKLEFKKTGFQPAKAKLYSKVAHDSVAVRLVKW